MIRLFLHKGKRFAILLLKYIIGIIPKQKNLVLFSAWFGQKYADSSMYMYEYLLDDDYFEACWYTRNRDIYKNLKSSNKPVVYYKSLKGIWIHIRAKILVSSVQFSDFNSFLLSNCILFDLDHGFPLKQIHFKQNTMTEKEKQFEYLLRQKVEFYMSASSGFCKDVISECYDVSPDKIVFCNKPRIDALFDSKLREGHNTNIDEYKKLGKVIVWMPTHRSDGKIPLNIEKVINLDKIQSICEEIDAVLVLKKHFYHRYETMDIGKYSRIFDITNENIESQTLLYQADVLISDYSASYIDYLVLDRPVILFAFDLERYLQTERGVYIKFKDNNVGYKPTNSDEFYDALKKIGNDWTDEIHSEGREELRLNYFSANVEIGSSRAKVRNILIELINHTYQNKWE